MWGSVSNINLAVWLPPGPPTGEFFQKTLFYWLVIKCYGTFRPFQFSPNSEQYKDLSSRTVPVTHLAGMGLNFMSPGVVGASRQIILLMLTLIELHHAGGRIH